MVGLNVRRSFVPIVWSIFFLTLCAAVAPGAVRLEGNVAGNPASESKACPVHPGNTCTSTLNPSSVTLLGSVSTWFKGLLEGVCAAPNWHCCYIPGSDNLKGAFNVDFYKAYNHCGVPPRPLLGAEIQVAFKPDDDSLIKDILWVSAFRETWPGHDASRMDDNTRLPNPAGTMGSPFYPYQDEDEDGWNPPRWQTNYQYDEFYDMPGDPCPTPGTTTSLRFETYAAYWDDYFNADGSITDVNNDGHWLYVHEGFAWGYDLTCVPEPMSLGLAALALLAAVRRRRTHRPQPD